MVFFLCCQPSNDYESQGELSDLDQMSPIPAIISHLLPRLSQRLPSGHVHNLSLRTRDPWLMRAAPFQLLIASKYDNDKVTASRCCRLGKLGLAWREPFSYSTSSSSSSSSYPSSPRGIRLARDQDDLFWNEGTCARYTSQSGHILQRFQGAGSTQLCCPPQPSLRADVQPRSSARDASQMGQ